ncbi:MAG TPA: hypothetical protein VE338_18425 [Ktedonobacterales bacterium]|nr:hypothetical protein [Ktedonobacterales bacterium]
MQSSVTIVGELEAEAGISQMEAAIQAAGRRAMRDALRQAVRSYEVTHAACPTCGDAQTQRQGTVTPRLLTCFGRVVAQLRASSAQGVGAAFAPRAGVSPGWRAARDAGVGRFFPCDGQHRTGAVDPDDARAATRRRNRQRASATAHVEKSLLGPNRFQRRSAHDGIITTRNEAHPLIVVAHEGLNAIGERHGRK